VRIKAVTATAAGWFACALTTAGGVQCWGIGIQGRLGNGSSATSVVPVPVTGLSSGVAAISAGGDFACAVTTGGALQCWGNGGNGELGNGGTSGSSVPVPVTGLSSGVLAVATGSIHACAVITGGALQCWGYNMDGELGNNSTTNSSTPIVVTGLMSPTTGVAAGGNHTCAIGPAGSVSCWGNNSLGQLGNNTTTNSLVPVATLPEGSGVTALAAGFNHTCALTTAGSVLCWGQDSFGQLGNNSTTNSPVPVGVSGLSGVTGITAGQYHTCARTTAGAMYCWGYNFYGQFGNNTTTGSSVPVAGPSLASGVACLAGGIDSSYAVTTAGALLSWGANSSGQLGNNSTQQSLVPVSVVEP